MVCGRLLFVVVSVCLVVIVRVVVGGLFWGLSVVCLGCGLVFCGLF